MIRKSFPSLLKLLKVINLAHLFGIGWLVSIAAFFGVIAVRLNGDSGLTEQDSTVLVFIVLTGIFAFLGASILYMIHYLFLRNKTSLRASGNVRKGFSPVFLILIVLILGFVGVVAVKGAYNLGQAEKLREAIKTPEPVFEEVTQPSTSTVKYVEKIQPIPSSTVQEEEKQPGNNLVSCTYYGQTFNLTPEDCRYFQEQEAGAKNIKNDGYVPSYHNYENSPTPVPASAPEGQHSTQEACRKNCYATYQNYPDTSLFKQRCVNSCSSKYPN